MLFNNSLRLSPYLATLCMALMITSPSLAERLNAVTIEDSLTADFSVQMLLPPRQAFVVARQAGGQATAANNLTGTFAISGSDIHTDPKLKQVDLSEY